MSTRDKLIYVTVALFCVTYIVLGNLRPPSTEPSPIVLSDTMRLLLRFTFIIPYFAAWFAGVYAGLTLLNTSETIPEEELKVAYTNFAVGIFVLIAGIITSSFLSSIRMLFVDETSQTVALTIVVNYVYVFGPLVGFWYIFKGSRNFLNVSNVFSPPAGQVASALAGLGLFLFAIGYVWLIFTNPTREISIGSVSASYYLPDFLIVVTIVIPFLASCVLAFLSAAFLAEYFRDMKGIVYKQTILNLIIGFVSVILGSLLLQALLSLGADRLLDLGIGVLLLIIYVFLFLITYGFISLAVAARKLAVIQRVLRHLEVKPAVGVTNFPE